MQRADPFTKVFSPQEWPHQLWLISCRAPGTPWKSEPRPLDGGITASDDVPLNKGAHQKSALSATSDISLGNATPAVSRGARYAGGAFGHMVPFNDIQHEELYELLRTIVGNKSVSLGLGTDGRITPVTDDMIGLTTRLNAALHSPLLPGGVRMDHY